MKPTKPRDEHIKRLRDRYRDSSTQAKKFILNDICLTWGISRKYAIKLLSGQRKPSGKKPGRKPRYDERLVKHVLILWESMERICPKRMKSALPVWLTFYRDPEFDPNLKFQLLQMSASTIERFLKRGRKRLKGLSTTKRSKFFRYKIPIVPENGKIVNVGHVQADTVAHCGDNISGTYAWSLTLTDRLTGWTENRAMPGKEAKNVTKATHSIECALPFRLRSFQSDCGTEFLNYTLLCFLNNRPAPVVMTRSRPYQKNDNAQVEQKNFTHVRELFGYERIDHLALIDLMNEIYRDFWNPLHNFFLPQMQLISKERVGSRIKKKHDSPKTPYERLKLHQGITDEGLAELERRYESLNPFELKKGLERKLEQFFSLLRQSKSGKKVA
jgi:hypothetical protein